MSHSTDDLLRVKQQNELILSAIGDGIYGIDVKGRATFVNPAAIKMTGWTEEEMIGQTLHDKHHHSFEDGSHYPLEACPIYAAVRDGKVHKIDNEVFWRKDGSCFPVEYISTPIYKDNKLAGAVVIFKDISERKKNEQDLRQAYQEVECMKEQLEAENLYLQEEIVVENNFKYIVGISSVIKQVLHQIELVAPTVASVLINGESGTGKELIARAIHEQSDRKERPLIKVNCAAIPRELFESEFFGHARGSFTGALKDRIGRFQLADGGTIFLDEVGEIPIELQSKLLRVLQEGQFERVGEAQTRRVDVRVITATNRDLQKEVEGNRFREDLFFRLNVFPIKLAPLRERIEDIPLLAEHFIKVSCGKLNRQAPKLTRANVKQLQAYPWRGNIRELHNVIERAMIVSGTKLQFDLKIDDTESLAQIRFNENIPDDISAQPYTELERIERDKNNIMLALKISNGKVSGKNSAAELLGIQPTTLGSRMKSLGIT